MRKIVVGLSGATGMPLAIALLKALQQQVGIETHVVISEAAKKTIVLETTHTYKEIEALANVVYDNNNIAASIASGTFDVAGMIIIPCSMKTVAGIANGYSDTLLLRAADVIVKEKRKLVLVARETPLSRIHLDNLAYLSSFSNVVIMPPMLSYYHLPQSIEDVESHLIGKILSQFDVEMDTFKRWK